MNDSGRWHIQRSGQLPAFNDDVDVALDRALAPVQTTLDSKVRRIRLNDARFHSRAIDARRRTPETEAPSPIVSDTTDDVVKPIAIKAKPLPPPVVASSQVAEVDDDAHPSRRSSRSLIVSISLAVVLAAATFALVTRAHHSVRAPASTAVVEARMETPPVAVPVAAPSSTGSVVVAQRPAGSTAARAETPRRPVTAKAPAAKPRQAKPTRPANPTDDAFDRAFGVDG